MKGSSPQGRWGFPPSDATQTEICSPDITTGKGRLPKKNHVKSVVFCQTSLDTLHPPAHGLVFSRRKQITHIFFLKMNHISGKQILHLVPSKNLYIFFCYISLHLPKISQNLISVGHSDQYITLH